MPEGPEVLMMTRMLSRMRGEYRITVFDRYLSPLLTKYDDLREFCKETHTFKQVFKKGKHTFVEFLPISTNSGNLGTPKIINKKPKIIIHLRYGLKGEITKEKTAYTKLIFESVNQNKNSQNFYFSDQIGYGDIEVLDEEEIREVLDNLGPSVENLKTYEEYRNAIDIYNGKKPIAELLVRQSCISGIGNYLRSEILYDAKVNPFKKAKDVTDDEHLRIYKSIRKIWNKVLSEYPNYKCRAYGNPDFASETLGSGLIYYKFQKKI